MSHYYLAFAHGQERPPQKAWNAEKKAVLCSFLLRHKQAVKVYKNGHQMPKRSKK
jgi:hypothetical protein